MTWQMWCPYVVIALLYIREARRRGKAEQVAAFWKKHHDRERDAADRAIALASEHIEKQVRERGGFQPRGEAN